MQVIAFELTKVCFKTMFGKAKWANAVNDTQRVTDGINDKHGFATYSLQAGSQ